DQSRHKCLALTKGLRMCRFVTNPGQIFFASALDRQDDQLRQLVGMKVADPRLERGESTPCRLDDELALGVALDLSLPAIDRGHRRQQVDAGGKPLVHERA